jgi:hypothetical protein
MARFARNEIEKRAYEIWEQAGRPQGRDLDHWLRAEAELAALTQKAKPAPKRPRSRTSAVVGKPAR